MGFFDSIKKSVQGAVDQVQQQVQPQQHQPPPPQQQRAAPPPPPPAPAEEAMEPGEFKRNYDLEARDDAASFDLKNDLGGYYVAEFRIEQAWDDLPTRYTLLKEYGVRDEPHYYQVKATVERFIQSPFAAQKWGGMGEIMHVKMKATQDYMMGGMQNKLQGELKGEIEPVEGVSLDQWATAMVKIVNQKPLDQILGAMGIDQAKWDRVSAEWNARMSRDTTATIATAYGKAFTNSSANEGKFGSAAQNPGQGNPPIPLEQYIEVMEAQNAGANHGKDASQILQSFGLSILDWSNLGSWFSAYFNENALKNDGALHKQWTALQEKYAAKYKSGSADSDIKF
jgi:hypothetical protein